MEKCIGEMVVFIKEIGSEEFNMAKEFYSFLVKESRKGNSKIMF